MMQVLAAVIVIHAGGLLADPGDASLREQTIVVTDGKITSVEKGYQPAERYGAEARLVDLKDRFVLPGLIDLHKHISMPLDADRETVESETKLALMTAAIARATLNAGVTTVRDIGDNVGVTFAVRDAINSGLTGRITHPRSGPHRLQHRRSRRDRRNSRDIEKPRGGCDGAESCRRVVRENIEAGSDWIKVTVSGSGGAPSGLVDAEPIMLPEEVRAVMEAARRGGRPVAAHAHSTAAIKLALESGARTIEHGTYFDDACARLFKSKGAFIVPTAYVAEFVGKQIERFSERPGKIAARKHCGAGRRPQWSIRAARGRQGFDSASAATRAVATTPSRPHAKSSCSSRAAFPLRTRSPRRRARTPRSSTCRIAWAGSGPASRPTSSQSRAIRCWKSRSCDRLVRNERRRDRRTCRH